MDFFMNNILNIVCYLPLAGMMLIMFIEAGKRECDQVDRQHHRFRRFPGFHPAPDGFQRSPIHRSGHRIPVRL